MNNAPASSTVAFEAPRAGRWDGLLCSLLVLLALLACRPFVEMGLIDDFSYVRTALVFARTGHFVYNGWTTAMLGAQIVWAAPFIRLLGYSFFATRVSMIVLSVLTVWLAHATFVRGGLRRSHAIFATLALGLCPLVVAMSVSFMTDVSGLFAVVAGIYGCLRALKARTSARSVLWLLMAVVAGLLGGTARQLPWLVALVMVPSTAWLLRQRRGVMAATVVMWLASLVSVLLCLRWFKHQLYSVPEPLLKVPLTLRTLRELAGTLLALLLCLVLMMMPALSSALPKLRTFRAKVWVTLFAASVACAVVARFITFHWQEKGWMPWTGDVLDKLGVLDYPNAWQLGVQPSLFSLHGRMVASCVVLFTALAFVLVVRSSKQRLVTDGTTGITAAELVWVLGPFSLAFVMLMLPRGLWTQMLDRYLLPLLPIALLFLLRLHQQRLASRVPLLSWCVLALFSAFAVLGTHDWIANHRARLAAVQQLEQAGVPVWKIEAGYEFDGTTQIDQQGVVYDPRVTYPASLHIAPYEPAGIAPDCTYLFNPHTPAVHAELFIANQQVPCLSPSAFTPVPYTAWLPPFHRQILILQRTR